MGRNGTCPARFGSNSPKRTLMGQTGPREIGANFAFGVNLALFILQCGSYNRTCKGDYARPFQPCKDVNANWTKTNISPLTAQVSRNTQETVVKRNFSHVNLYIDSTGRVSNCSNSNLKGPLGLLRLCSFKSHSFFFFFIEYVLFTILTYDRNYFHAVQIVNCHFNTSRTTTQVPQTCILEYVRNIYHQFSRILSENEIDVIKDCEIVLNLVLLNTGVVFSLELMEL